MHGDKPSLTAMAQAAQTLCFTCRRDFELDRLIESWQDNDDGKIGISIRNWDISNAEEPCALCSLVYNAATTKGKDAIRNGAGVRIYCNPTWHDARYRSESEQRLDEVLIQTASGADLTVRLRLQALEGT